MTAPHPTTGRLHHRVALAAALAAASMLGGTRASLAGGKASAAASSNGAGAGVQVDKVRKGQASFSHDGSRTVIRAGDNSIINYQRFDIPAGASVQFVQPSVSSRVLNRINSAAPSRLDGTLSANGTVYFVNPAGVLFGQGAVVNVGKLYAAAGSIGDGEFLGGVNHFSHLSGPIANAGHLQGNAIYLVGQNVTNSGTIVGSGLVATVAGNDVYLSEQGGSILVRIDPPAVPVGQAKSVAPSRPPAPKYALGASDVYALAINQTGQIKAKNITVAAGQQSQANVGGTLDASNASPHAVGGNVQITAGRVAIVGAKIDASGDVGGGTILVGGNAHGTGTGPAGAGNAAGTFFSLDSSLRADATGKGDGGSVVLWADGATRAYGSISARGGPAGGNGGFVETSGHTYLDARTVPDVTESSTAGKAGTWLLDPSNVTIVNGPTGSGSIDVQTPNFTATSDNSTISNGTIVRAIESGQNVVVSTANVNGTQAGDITQNADAAITVAPLGGGSLTLTADNNVTLRGGMTATSGGFNLTVNARQTNLASAINTGTGDVTFNSPVVVTADSSVGGNNITFNNSISSASAAAPRALAINPSGFLLFVGNIGTNESGTAAPLSTLIVGANGTTAIGEVENPVPTVVTTGNQVYGSSVTLGASAVTSQAGAVLFQAPVALSHDASVHGRRGVTFDSTIDSINNLNVGAVGRGRAAPAVVNGAFELTVTSPAFVSFNGVVGGSQPLGSLTADTSGLLTLNTPLVRVAGDVNLNPTATSTLPSSNGVPTVATITGSPGGGDLAIRSDGNVSMGPRQKLTVIGSLSVGGLNADPASTTPTTPAASVTAGDISALGSIFVNANQITLQLRPAGRVLLPDGTLTPDGGVDVIAGGGIASSVPYTTTGVGAQPVVVRENVTAANFTLAGTETTTVLDLSVPPAVPTPTPTPTGFTGDIRVIEPNPTPFLPPGVAETVPKEMKRVREEIIITKALRDRMIELGIYARDLHNDEYLGLLLGRGVFNDSPRRQTLGASDFTVAANRLTYDPVIAVAKAYEAVFYEGGTKQEGRIREAVDKAWSDYSEKAGDAASGTGFRAFLSANRDKYAAAGYVDRLHTLLKDINAMGLTPAEGKVSEAVLFQNITPDSLGRRRFLETILARP